MTPAPDESPVIQFNTRLSVRHRAMLRELAATPSAGERSTLRLALEEAIEALVDARRTDPRAGLEVPAKEIAVQVNTTLSQAHRALLDDLVAHHPLGGLATLPDLVTEEADRGRCMATFGQEVMDMNNGESGPCRPCSYRDSRLCMRSRAPPATLRFASRTNEGICMLSRTPVRPIDPVLGRVDAALFTGPMLLIGPDNAAVGIVDGHEAAALAIARGHGGDLGSQVTSA